VPDPGTFVVDTAHVFDDATRAKLEDLLERLYIKTGDQIKVLSLTTTDGEDIFSFSQRHYQLWKLGSKKTNNGALIVLAVQDRKVRIHTGYGLEGALPDGWTGEVSRKVRDEYFRAGRYGEGLYQLALATINRVAADRGVTLEGLPPVRQPNVVEVAPGTICFLLIPVLLFIAIALWSRKQRHRQAWGGGFFESYFWASLLQDILTSSARGGSSGGWSSGSGGWSSGGGGFGGGGGGGTFGGGGSSGGGGGGASW
jgi:uncharacterized protein